VVSTRFRLVRLLHRSDMSTIVLCEDAQRDSYSVIKALNPDLVDDELVCSRFVQEADVLEALDHPGIVPVLARGQTHEGSPFYAMPYFPRGSLADRLMDPDSLTTDVVVGFGLEVLDALDHVHREGVIHRDIKPGNVLLDDSDVAVLCDFGIASLDSARSTMQGAELATPGYAPPEQIADPRKAEARSDLYALGVTLFVLATGRRAVELVRPATRQASLGRLSAGLGRCVRRATEPSLSARYSSAADMADALAELLT